VAEACKSKVEPNTREALRNRPDTGKVEVTQQEKRRETEREKSRGFGGKN